MTRGERFLAVVIVASGVGRDLGMARRIAAGGCNAWCARNLCTVPAVAPSSTGSRCRERIPLPRRHPRRRLSLRPLRSDASQATTSATIEAPNIDTTEPRTAEVRTRRPCGLRSELIRPKLDPFLAHATHLLKAGRRRCGRAVALKRLGGWPGNAAILHDLGLACLECAGSARPSLALQSSVAVDPGFQDSHLRLGMAFEAAGAANAALAAYHADRRVEAPA